MNVRTFLDELPEFLQHHNITYYPHGAFYRDYPFLIIIEYEKLVVDTPLFIRSSLPDMLHIEPSYITLSAGILISHPQFVNLQYIVGSTTQYHCIVFNKECKDRVSGPYKVTLKIGKKTISLDLYSHRCGSVHKIFKSSVHNWNGMLFLCFVQYHLSL